MSTDGIDALLRKREELLAQVQGLKSEGIFSSAPARLALGAFAP